jgi:4-amino-4-deoxy-L-arabinose transferase-like glycosyltransferase
VAIFVAIFAVALSLRLVYLHQWQNCPIFTHPKIDEQYHDEWAQAIAAGETYEPGAYFRAPLYPAFLGAIYWLFGHDYYMPRVMQSILTSLSCGLVFLVGRVTFGRAVGAVAGFSAATYWTLIFFDGELLIPPIIIFLDLVLVAILLKAARSPAVVWPGLAGVVMGLSALARPNILLLGPAIVVWLIVLHRRRFWRAFACCVAVTAGCLLMLLPVTIRNYIVSKDFVLIASQGGLNFYIGNNARSDGRTALDMEGPLDFWGTNYRATLRAEQALGRELKPSEVSDYHYKLAWDFIQTHPGEALRLNLLKLRLFWSKWEIANNKNLYFWTPLFAPMVNWLPLSFGVVGPLGIVGLALCWRRRLELFPLWGFVLVYMVSIVMFFCTARYRLPVVPVLILLATWAVFEAVRAIRGRRWVALGLGGVVLVPAVLLVHVTPHREAVGNDFVSHTMLGHVYDDHGDPEQAIEQYRMALSVVPGNLEATYGLGSALTKLNRLPEGLGDFRRAIEGPRVPLAGETVAMQAAVHSNFATALAQTGAYVEAVEQYSAAIALNPTGGGGSDQFNLALVLGALGRRDEALRAFAEAVRVDSKWQASYGLLAPYLGEQGAAPGP